MESFFMHATLMGDIQSILCYENENDIGNELRREGIAFIRDCGSGAVELPPGGLRTIHTKLTGLLSKNGSATTSDRTKIRCIGALGLIRRRCGLDIPPEHLEVCNWLFSIAVSSTEELAPLVSRRAGFILEMDRIIQR